MSIKKSLFQLSIAFWIFTFLVPRGQAGFFDPKLKWYTVSTKHFNIHYHNGEEEVAFRIAMIAEKVFAEMSPRWKWKPWGRTEVVLTDTTDVSNALTTTLPYNYIVLFIAAPPGDSTLNYYDDYLEYLFTHEFTHTLHLDMHGGPVNLLRYTLGRIVTPNGLTPAWIREGMAVQQESLDGKGRVNSSFSEMMLRTDILNDEFLRIDQMAGLQYEWPSFNAGYIYGGKFWAYLAEKYGQEKMIEFSHRYSDSLWFFSLNDKARVTYGDKNFYKLKREWKAYLTEKYQKLKAELEAQGLTSLQDFRSLKKTSFTAPTLSPDGKSLIYSLTNYKGKPELRRINTDGTGDELIIKGRLSSQYSFSPDGKKLAYGAIGFYKNYYNYYDLHVLDLETKKVSQLTHGLRAYHPDYSPDGKQLVFVANKVNTTQMHLWDIEKKTSTALTHEKETVQFSFPRFSPDGKTIAVSAWKDGKRDIYLYDLQGNVTTQVTSDDAIDLYPEFSQDGADLFFTSDRSGITNVYRYNLASETIEQISNVLTGVFYPQFSNGKFFVQHYYGRGYDLKTFDYALKDVPVPKVGARPVRYPREKHPSIDDSTGEITTVDELKTPREPEGPIPTFPKSPHPDVPAPQTPQQMAPSSDSAYVAQETENGRMGEGEKKESPTPPDSHSPILSQPPPEVLKGPKKYNPFTWKLFVPQYLIPSIFFSDSLTLVGTTGSSDPLGRHAWTGSITYRTDANYLGGSFLYTYNRLRPTFFLGYLDYVVNYGDVFATGDFFFEARRRAYTGVSFGHGRHNLSGYYFFENRSEHSGVPPGAFVPPTLGNFSGFGLLYRFTRVNHFPASISLEGGPRLIVSVEASDSIFGASPGNEQVVLAGDLREYVHLGGNHVLAFRAAGGITFGDKLLQGTFRLGSATGESILSAPSPRLFTLRGLPEITFAGEKALLLSGEYRLPLFNPQRGAGTGPIHLQKMHMAFFADYGSVFDGDIDFTNFLLGVGAELRGDFIFGYGLPLTIRLGYGIIVYGRQFIQGLTDPVLGNAITNGTLIFSLGTSF